MTKYKLSEEFYEVQKYASTLPLKVLLKKD